jgi:tetratricopeptide (TPR) repeat protein
MKEQNQIEYKVTFEQTKSTSLGEIDSDTPEAVDIGRRIHESLQNMPANIAHDALEQVQDKISENAHSDAIGILRENAFFISKLTDKRVLSIIDSINSLGLDPELRKYHLLLSLAYASHINATQAAVNYIDLLENEFGDTLDEQYLNGFILERAQLALDKGQRSLAVISYNELTYKKNASSRHVAVAYQGLAFLSSSDEDRAHYTKLSADKFLESGAKKSAISNLLVLSGLQAKELPALALETLEICLKLVNSEDIYDRHGKASLLQSKAEYLHKLGRKKQALETIEEAFVLEEGVLGAENSLHTSYRLAAQYASELGLGDKSNEFIKSAISIASTIKDEIFILQSIVAEHYIEHEQLSKELLEEVLDFGNSSLIGTVLLKESINPANTLVESMMFLEDALKHLEKRDSKNLIDLVHFHFGFIYQKQGLKGAAETSYLKSLDANPYNYSSANNLALIYMEDESWTKAENFFSARVKLLGELPNICFLYGKALYKQHKYQEALSYFRKANPDINNIQDLIEQCIDNMSKGMVSISFKPEFIVHITSDDILAALKEFSETISHNSRMHFWQFDKTKGKYKWSSRPEETTKQLLIASLSAKFGKDNITIIQEQRAGAGFIDLYVLFSGGLKVVIELKMCGEGYSSSYAISGEDQIIHYQNNTEANLGYLLIFDARKRDFAKGLKDIQIVGNKTIYSIAVDVRNKVK